MSSDQTSVHPKNDEADTEQRIHALAARVGQRVRWAREQRNLSRRELSQVSGVSQRYLAAVETGQGNISIALLLKVGDALGHPVGWFVEMHDPAIVGAAGACADDAARMAALYQRADPAQQQSVREILAPNRQGDPKARRIAVIGLRGAGKSTLGARASERLAMPFVELNDDIEAQSGMPVADVMALYGPEGYRRFELRALNRVVETHERVILAVAGGIVSAPATFDLLLDRFHTIWLRADPRDHMDRVRAQGDERPMAGHPAAFEELKEILAGREALYARADLTLETSGKAETAALEDMLALIAAQPGLR